MFFSSDMPLLSTAFSNQPFSFTSAEAHDDLAAILEIDLIENKNKAARLQWQSTQLYNLIQFAYAHSHFWRQRIPRDLQKLPLLAKLPILHREALALQVKTEGSLAKGMIGGEGKSYASSGSTGTPVSVHICPQNIRYNKIRNLAQYFMEGRSLNQNRTLIRPADGKDMLQTADLHVEKKEGWLGHLSNIFSNGHYKEIHFASNPAALVAELSKDPVGYLACLSSHIDLLLQYGGIALLERLKIHMWVHHSDNRDPQQLEIFQSLGIPCRSTYSCSEAGAMGVECPYTPGYYHVTHTNVIVEVDKSVTVEVAGNQLGRVLVTHLHSYATPLIRYDVGDFAQLVPSCPCGHDGDTLCYIYGRSKYFLRNEDGTLRAFPIFSKPLLDITQFSEFFICQTGFNKLVIELGGRDNLESEEIEAIQKFLQRLAGRPLEVEVVPLAHIDWRKNPKRLPFLCRMSCLQGIEAPHTATNHT